MVPKSNAASYHWASHLTEPKDQVQKRRKYKYKSKGAKGNKLKQSFPGPLSTVGEVEFNIYIYNGSV